MIVGNFRCIETKNDDNHEKIIVIGADHDVSAEYYCKPGFELINDETLHLSLPDWFPLGEELEFSD